MCFLSYLTEMMFSDTEVGNYYSYTSYYSWICGSNQSFTHSANGGEQRFLRTELNAGRSSHEKAVCPSVRLSVCLSNAWIATKQNKVLLTFLYQMKDHLA